jgi:hypothetical protein
MSIEELYVVKEALEEAVKRLNIEVLFMTATNPFLGRFFTRENEAQQICGGTGAGEYCVSRGDGGFSM